MTQSQERLVQKLTKLNGGKYPLRKWSLGEVYNELALVVKQPNQSFLSLEGEFETRYVGDSLSGAGFGIMIDENKHRITISW